MTRKVNLSHLNKDECERILAVIQRDCNLRQKEQERLSKIEEELNDKASQRSVLAKRKEFNEKWCILCCSTFNLLFNKKFYCHDCHFYVCRSCAVWESQEKVWLCRLCEHQRVLYVQSCEWFYDHVRKKFKHFGSSKIFIRTLYKKKKESDSENDSGYGPTNEYGATSKSFLSLFSPRIHNESKQEEHGDSASVAGSHYSQVEEEEDIGEVRQHVETVVEGLIGSNSLDTARVDCLYNHRHYDQIFAKYHPQLATASGLLCNALHRALQNNLPPEGEITPTAAHAALKHIIMEIKEEANALPKLKKIDDSSQTNSNSKTALPDNSNHTIYTTYNELLAAAILNKLIEMQQDKYKKDSNHLATEINDFKESNNNESSSDDENENRNARNLKEEFSWTDNLGKSQPRIEYVIEEIEEITQECTDSEEDQSSRMSRHSSCQSINDAPLTKTVITSTDEIPDFDSFNELDIDNGQKVPFPELGMDIIELNEENQTDIQPGIDSCLLSVAAWEDNWLYRKKRFPIYSSLGMRLMSSYSDPPSMVIPNPADDIQILIGSKQVDQLSELSETNSVGSLVFSSENSSDEEQSEDKSNLSKSVQEIKVSEIKINLNHLKTSEQSISNSVPKFQSYSAENNVYFKNMNGLSFPKYSPQSSRNLKIFDPVFINVPENQTLHAGKIARFMCQAKGTNPIGVAWFRGKEPLQPGPQYSMYSINNQHILEIYNTNSSDTDTYSCVLFNKKGENWKDFSLKIKETSRAETSPEFVIPLRVLQNTVGQSAKLMCTVNGYPEPRVHVIFNSQEVENDEKYHIYNTGYGEWLIEITKFEFDDQGEYLVFATNKLGQSVSSATIYGDNCSIKESISEKSTNIDVTNRKETEAKQIPSKTKIPRNKKELSNFQSTNINECEMDSKSEDTGINDLNSPPRPGTIAEREHKKWLNAIPLRNNPYSAANIAKRMGRRTSSIELTPSYRPLTYEEFECQQKKDEHEAPENIPILSSTVDPSRYQRDYYINHITNNKKKKINNKEMPTQGIQEKKLRNSMNEKEEERFYEDIDNEEALNSLEEKVYISTGKIFTLEDHVRQLEREVQLVTNIEEMTILENKTAKVVDSVADNDKQISHLEDEIFRLQNTTNGKYSSETLTEQTVLSESSKCTNEEFPSLPSVKDLATKFMPSDSTINVKSSQITKQAVPEKKVIVIDKTSKNYMNDNGEDKQKTKFSHQPNRMIHSLTARNLPREFRKQAREHFPRPMNRTIFFTNSDNGRHSTNVCSSDKSDEVHTIVKKNQEIFNESCHGYTSDESTTSNNSTSTSKSKRKTSQSILQRASYWEKRAEQNLLSDNSVCEDFPEMENIPN